MRYELTDYEWMSIRPMLPNKTRGVPRVNDPRILNGISGFSDQRPLGAICRRHLAHTLLVTIGSSAGGKLVWGVTSLMHCRYP